MGTICPQCGDKGFTNAFVYCVKCLDFAIHRYCLDVVPDSFDELVYWLCDDCEVEEAQKHSAIGNHYIIPFQTRDDIGSENVTKQTHLLVVATEEHINKDGPEQLYNTCTKLDSEQPEEKKEKDNLMQPTSSLKGTAKKIKKRKRSIINPTKEKDEHSPSNSTSSEKSCNDKCIKVCCGLPPATKLPLKVNDDMKVCIGLAGDTKLPSKVKDDKKMQTGLTCDTNLLSKAKGDKNIHSGLVHAMKLRSKVKDDKKMCTRLARDTKLPSNVKDDKKVCNGLACNTKVPSNVKDTKRVRNGSTCDTKLPSKVKDDKEVRNRSACDTKLPSNVKDDKKMQSGAGGDTKLPSNVKGDKKLHNGSACNTKLPSKVKDDKQVSNRLECDTKLPSNVKDDMKVSNRLACDSIVPSKVKDDKVSDKRDHKRISVKSTNEKKKKTVISPKKILQEQMRRTDFAQPLLENKALDLGNQCAEKCAEEKKHSRSEDQFGSGQLEDRRFAACDMNNFYEDFPKDLHISSAEPVAMPIWKGSFNIWNGKCDVVNGLLAHVSILACQKVYDEGCQFQPVLHLEMLPKSNVWPKSFETSEPRGDNIALYFFPSKSSECAFDHLVDEMMRKELALKAIVQNAELLIFNSSELPLLYWKFQGKYYLWGVFRQKQSPSSNSQPHREELKDENGIKHMDKTSVATKKRGALSPCSPLSNSASYGSQNPVS